MDTDFTVISTTITAFAAIVAPTITALIHSVKEYKISKMNHTIGARLKLCQSFSDAYSNCQYGPEKNRTYVCVLQKSIRTCSRLP